MKDEICRVQIQVHGTHRANPDLRYRTGPLSRSQGVWSTIPDVQYESRGSANHSNVVLPSSFTMSTHSSTEAYASHPWLLLQLVAVRSV